MDSRESRPWGILPRESKESKEPSPVSLSRKSRESSLGSLGSPVRKSRDSTLVSLRIESRDRV